MSAGSRQRLAVSVGIALATIGMQLPFFDRWFSAMDEGHILLFSEMVARGGTLYRDATLYPLPGAFYLLALLFRLFEPSVLVARWTVVVEFALFAAVVHDLMRRAVPARLALVAVPLLWAWRVWCFPHWQMYSYSTTALLLYAVSLRLLVWHLESGRRGPLAAAGLVFGLGVFCKQDYGAAALLASVLTLAVAARTRPLGSTAPRFAAALAIFLAPAGAVGLVAALHFLERGVLGDVIRFCVFNHFSGMAHFEYPSFPRLFPLLAQDPSMRQGAGLFSQFPGLPRMLDYERIKPSWWYRATPLYELYAKALIYGPWLVLVGGALRLWIGRRRLADCARRGAALVEVALVASAGAFMLLVQFVKPQDYVHLFVLQWPFFALALVYTDALWRARRRLAWASLALLSPLALAAFLYTARLAWGLRLENPAPIQLARAEGIYVRDAEARILREIVDTVQARTRPGESIGVFPYDPLVNFLADRPGVHRTGYIVWPVPEIEGRDRALIDAMEELDTKLVIYDFAQFPSLPRMDLYAPELYAYLVDHFEISRTFYDDHLQYKLAALRRDEAPPPGRPLLEGIADGELRVEQDGLRQSAPPARRDALARIELWPFRPVVSLKPGVGRRTVLSLPLRVEPGDRLLTAVGAHPDSWFRRTASRIELRIEAVSGDTREALFTRTLAPQRRIGDREWSEVDLPLDAWAGREIALEFSAEASAPVPQAWLFGAFAVPRIVSGATGLRPTTR